MKEEILNNFDKCFINDFPSQMEIDFDKNKKLFKFINNSATSSKLMLAISACCIPGAFVFSFSVPAVACLGIACLSTMVVGFQLNSISKRKYQQLVDKNLEADFVNYNIYRQNEKLKKMVCSYKKDDEVVAVKQAQLIKENYKSLMNIEDASIINLEAKESFFESEFEDFEGNLNNLIKIRDKSLARVYSNVDYVASHINKNAELYYQFAPEYLPSIQENMKLIQEVEKIKAPFLSEEYIAQRLDIANRKPLQLNLEILEK